MWFGIQLPVPHIFISYQFFSVFVSDFYQHFLNSRLSTFIHNLQTDVRKSHTHSTDRLALCLHTRLHEGWPVPQRNAGHKATDILKHAHPHLPLAQRQRKKRGIFCLCALPLLIQKSSILDKASTFKGSHLMLFYPFDIDLFTKENTRRCRKSWDCNLSWYIFWLISIVLFLNQRDLNINGKPQAHFLKLNCK